MTDNDCRFLALSVLNDEHSALLAMHKKMYSRVDESESLMFALVDQMTTILESCTTNIERIEKEQNRSSESIHQFKEFQQDFTQRFEVRTHFHSYYDYLV